MQSIECGNCAAACCSNIPIALNQAEVGFLRGNGTRLLSHADASLDPSKELYQMVGACGLLDPATNSCMAYYDPRRPDLCIRLRSGSIECADIRVAKGVPTRADIFEEAPDGRAAISEISMGYLYDFDVPAVSSGILAQLPDATPIDTYITASL